MDRAKVDKRANGLLSQWALVFLRTQQVVFLSDKNTFVRQKQMPLPKRSGRFPPKSETMPSNH